jgi:hypothetical protein
MQRWLSAWSRLGHAAGVADKMLLCQMVIRLEAAGVSGRCPVCAALHTDAQGWALLPAQTSSGLYSATYHGII